MLGGWYVIMKANTCQIEMVQESVRIYVSVKCKRYVIKYTLNAIVLSSEHDYLFLCWILNDLEQIWSSRYFELQNCVAVLELHAVLVFNRAGCSLKNQFWLIAQFRLVFWLMQFLWVGIPREAFVPEVIPGGGYNYPRGYLCGAWPQGFCPGFIGERELNQWAFVRVGLPRGFHLRSLSVVGPVKA